MLTGCNFIQIDLPPAVAKQPLAAMHYAAAEELIKAKAQGGFFHVMENDSFGRPKTTFVYLVNLGVFKGIQANHDRIDFIAKPKSNVFVLKRRP